MKKKISSRFFDQMCRTVSLKHSIKKHIIYCIYIYMLETFVSIIKQKLFIAYLLIVDVHNYVALFVIKESSYEVLDFISYLIIGSFLFSDRQKRKRILGLVVL